MVKNVARQHSAVADVVMAKGADEYFFNGREELLAKGFVRTVILVEEFDSGGVGIPEGRDFSCGGSNKNI